MAAPASAWAATALADPAQVGAATVRALALRLAGELPGRAATARDDAAGTQITVAVPGQLITQADLRFRAIATADQLWPALPNLPGIPTITVATAPWLPAVS